jgi:uncharacterized protein YbbC (DUF1343 family)/CubicO group peptidase (beta-lactamase class C family)
MKFRSIALVVIAFAAFTLAAPADPAKEFHLDRLEAMDQAVAKSLRAKNLPGCVIWLEREGTVHSKAYGRRAVVPAEEPMTVDTVFDLASLTKSIATGPAIMLLVEDGKIDVDAPVSHYLEGFRGNGKEHITVRHLLTHTSGLRAGLSLGGWSGKNGALERACAEPLPDPPGTVFRYSDINFILLGLLAEQVSGQPLDAFTAERLFRPLGMEKTGFRPMPAASLPEIAPTEVERDGTVIRGSVHDPTARRIGGVAGHAGLFSNAADLARFCRMMLNEGELDGVRVFKPETVRSMIRVQSPPELPRRGFGWDIDSPYAGQRGLHFPIGGYGHTGWTGTSLWIDPFSRAIVIFLSNRNHLPGNTNVLPLRRELSTLAAQAIRNFNFLHVPGALPADSHTIVAAPPPTNPLLNGIDVLKQEEFAALKGLKIGLVTNHTGQDRERNSTIDLLHQAADIELQALFSPEHGIRGELDQENIGDSRDAATGLPVFSLYGERRAPDPAQLEGLDALVFDIQDIGCRFYTYIATMTRCMEAAAKTGIRFIVLDRANPIGARVEGPVLTEKRAFVAPHEIPVRHGMTVGELAGMINAEQTIGAQLSVVRCAEASPLRWFDDTGLPWRDPSPNMRSLSAATLYPGVALLEFCQLSVGRGTDTPFEIIGAPYIDDVWLAGALNGAGLPGVKFVPVRFTPRSSTFANVACGGVRILITDRDALRPLDLGIVLASVLQRRHAGELAIDRMLTLLGDRPTLEAIKAGKPLSEIKALWSSGLIDFEARREPWLLYPRK